MTPSFDMIWAGLLYAIAIPAAAVLAVASLSSSLSARSETDSPRGTIRWTIAVIAAVIVGCDGLARTGQLGWDFLHPSDAASWLPALAIALTLAGLVEGAVLRTSRSRWVWRACVAAGAAWTLHRAESAIQPVAMGWIVALALAIVGLWGSLDAASSRIGRPWILSAMMGCAALTASAVLMLAGIAKFATMAALMVGVLLGVAGVAGAGVAGVGLRASSSSRQETAAAVPIPLFAALLPGLLFAGYFNTYSQVPGISFLAALAAPLAMGGGSAMAATTATTATGRRTRGVAIGIAVGLMALAVVSAVVAERPWAGE